MGPKRGPVAPTGRLEQDGAIRYPPLFGIAPPVSSDALSPHRQDHRGGVGRADGLLSKSLLSDEDEKKRYSLLSNPSWLDNNRR